MAHKIIFTRVCQFLTQQKPYSKLEWLWKMIEFKCQMKKKGLKINPVFVKLYKKMWQSECMWVWKFFFIMCLNKKRKKRNELVRTIIRYLYETNIVGIISL